MLDQTGQRRQVASAITKLGKEPHNRLGGMIGADNQSLPGIGNGVLRHHAHPRLGIADNEVTFLRRQVIKRFGRSRQALHGGADVDRMALIRLDRIDCKLRFIFVMLDLVGEPDSNESVVVAFPSFAHALNGALRKQPGSGRVDPTTDAQYQRLEPRIAQALLNEGDPPVNLGLYCCGPIERCTNVKRSSDFLLAMMHGFLLAVDKVGKTVANPTITQPINLLLCTAGLELCSRVWTRLIQVKSTQWRPP